MRLLGRAPATRFSVGLHPRIIGCFNHSCLSFLCAWKIIKLLKINDDGGCFDRWGKSLTNQNVSQKGLPILVQVADKIFDCLLYFNTHQHPHNPRIIMTATDDISTIGGEDSISQAGTVEVRMAFLQGQLAALRDFREQITKLAESEQGNLLLKAKLELLVQQDKEEIALLREQIDALQVDVAMLEKDILTLKASKMEQQVARRHEDPKSAMQPTEPDERFLASGEVTSATKPQSKSSTGGSPPTILPKSAPTLKETVAQSPRVWLNGVMMFFAIFGYIYMLWLPKNAPVYGWKSSESSISRWKSSESSISRGRVGHRMIDVLDFPGLQGGTYTWKIKILREAGVRLGVVSSLERNHMYEKNLGTTGVSWGYGGYGDAWNNDRQVGGWHVGFSTGSIVTFRLDLTGKGRMRVAVDDEPMVLVYDNMKTEGRFEYFIPAVYLFDASSIQILGFQEIR
jgi:hypothetical protein